MSPHDSWTTSKAKMIYRQLTILVLCILPVVSSAADRPINVSVVNFDDVAYYPQGSSPATVVSLNDATLAAQIDSSVESVPVLVGDIVKHGDMVVQLDCRVVMANNASARAKYSLAQYQLQRAKTLNKSNHVSEEVLRTRQSELEVARSSLSTSEVDVEHCKVTAPFNGVIAERLTAVGEWVSRGQPVVRLIDLDHVEVSAQISDSIIDELSEVHGFYLSVNDKTFPLKLRTISKNVEQLSRTREVRFLFEDQQAHPGQTGRVVWKSARRYLPADYLVKRNQKYGVFIHNNSRAHFLEVSGAQEGRPFYMDLNADAQLISRGRYTVQDNDAVNVIR